MNNEPVAWMNKDDSSLSFKNHGGGWQPLYLHPAKEQELLAEIEALKVKAHEWYLIAMGKAQEK